MLNMTVSRALLKNMVCSGNVPTSNDFDVITAVFEGKENCEKVAYVLGFLTEYSGMINAASNTEQYYQNFVASLFEKYGISDTNANAIAKLVYFAQELTNRSKISSAQELDEKIEYISTLLKKVDEIYEQDEYYFIVLFRVSSIFLCLSLEDFKKYHSISFTCCKIYLKYYAAVCDKYDGVIIV